MGVRRTSPCTRSRTVKTRSRSNSKRVSRPFSTSILRYNRKRGVLITRRHIRPCDETDLSGTREQAARKGALAAEPHRVGGALCAGARSASVRDAMADTSCESINVGESGWLDNLSQHPRDCLARDCGIPLAALATTLAAAEPVDCYVCFYWRDSSFSAGDDFSDHALSSCRAVRQLCRDIRHHNSFAQHGSREPSHRPSHGSTHFREWKARCRSSRTRKTASSGMVAGPSVRVVPDTAEARLRGARGG